MPAWSVEYDLARTPCARFNEDHATVSPLPTHVLLVDRIQAGNRPSQFAAQQTPTEHLGTPSQAPRAGKRTLANKRRP